VSTIRFFPSRARGCVITLIRAMSFTVETSFRSQSCEASEPIGFSSTSSAPAASAS
jgi:hypothetical protein